MECTTLPASQRCCVLLVTTDVGEMRGRDDRWGPGERLEAAWMWVCYADTKLRKKEWGLINTPKEYSNCSAATYLKAEKRELKKGGENFGLTYHGAKGCEC